MQGMCFLSVCAVPHVLLSVSLFLTRSFLRFCAVNKVEMVTKLQQSLHGIPNQILVYLAYRDLRVQDYDPVAPIAFMRSSLVYSGVNVLG